jgi:hypothetical protein
LIRSKKFFFFEGPTWEKVGHDGSGPEVIDIACLHLPAAIRDFRPPREERESRPRVGAGLILPLCQPYDPAALFLQLRWYGCSIPHILTCHSILAKPQYARHNSSSTPLSGSRGSALPTNTNSLVTALPSRIDNPHPEIRFEGVRGIGDCGALARRLRGDKSWGVWRGTSKIHIEKCDPATNVR